MEQQVKDKVKTIKQSFRLHMNGVVFHSMKNKGLDYKLNWGVGLPQLKEMAADYGKNHALASELWKENVRECKILATLIMPHEQMTEQEAMAWIDEMPTIEMAEIASMNLFQHLSCAKSVAWNCIEGEKETEQLIGYHILSAMFRRRVSMGNEDVDIYIKRAAVAFRNGGYALRHAVMNSLVILCDVMPEREQTVNDILESHLPEAD